MKLKLWQAILIGSDRRAQAFGAGFRTHPDGSKTSCALGAAFEGTFNTTGIGNGTLHEVYPHLWDAAEYPCTCGEKASLGTIILIIQHLNDSHKWPREKIALSFVKPLEESEL